MKRSAFSLIAVALFSLVAFCATAESKAQDPVVASASKAIAATDAGKLQGYIHNGTFTFHGVQYAKADRFMPPVKVDSWQGIKLALTYGNICPVPASDAVSGDDFFNPHRYWPQNENCQNLNIWSQGLKDGKKRPVMVFIHGGGYSFGSSIEQVAYDGESLSKKGDIVVVTLNHRLNVLGFLDLSAYGDKYKYSGNVGIMDLVAALKWIQTNIAEFGGDPANVTLFGQSAGGGKILSLMAAPAAKGLFQKAIIESGGGNTRTQAVSRKVGQYTLQNLGIDPKDIDKLATVPYDQLMGAGFKALMMTKQELKINEQWFGFAPVMDGDYIPFTPGEAEALAKSKDIPLIIGNVFSEQNSIESNDSAALEADNPNNWSADRTKEMLTKKFGTRADSVAKAFAKAYPDKKASSAYFVDMDSRPTSIQLSDLKSKLGGAPVYTYMFTWESPVMDGIGLAWHCSEIPFVFNNIAITETATGGGKNAYQLADKMSQAWISFARTGNPNNASLPAWPEYTTSKGSTMIFDNACVVKNDYDKELMNLAHQ